MGYYYAKYRVNNGTYKIKAPNDKARTEYEYIRVYGIPAVIERVKRSRKYAQMMRDYPEAVLIEIQTPKYEQVTQF